jgi:hypothetical protein
VKTSDAIQAIVRVTVPYIGDTMARAAASAQCQKLGIGSGVIQVEQVDQLLGRLGTGLSVFLGRPGPSSGPPGRRWSAPSAWAGWGRS